MFRQNSNQLLGFQNKLSHESRCLKNHCILDMCVNREVICKKDDLYFILYVLNLVLFPDHFPISCCWCIFPQMLDILRKKTYTLLFVPFPCQSKYSVHHIKLKMKHEKELRSSETHTCMYYYTKRRKVRLQDMFRL